MSDDIDTTMVFVSDAELAVLRAMRRSDHTGDAIFRYAMSYDDYGELPPMRDPYEFEMDPYEEALEGDPRDLLTG